MAPIARYSVDGTLGCITLANPPQNTLPDPEFADSRELAAFVAGPQLKGIVVCGEGRHFCAGADLPSLRSQAADPSSLARRLDKGKQLLEMLRAAPVPMVAAIRGSCLGAGLEIAMACHFRVAAHNALLGFPESQHGLVPGMSGTATGLPRAVLARLVLSGDMIGGDEARSLGIVDQCCATGRVVDEAGALLRSLVERRSARLVHAAMTSIHDARRLPRAEALAAETRIFCELVSQAPPGAEPRQ
jgi:enoyl-CoA hydratase